MKVESRLEAFRKLIEHPSTPEAERLSAQRRLDELRERLREPRFADVLPKSKGSASFKGRRRARPERPISEEWPFGWEGPCGPIEHEKVENAMTGDWIFNWKCPACYEHVTRVVSRKKIIRLKGREGQLERYFEELTNGTVNQLCRMCTEKFA